MIEIGREYRLEVENVVASALTASAITNASPPVVTSAAHGLAVGDYVKFGEVEGMPELSYMVCRLSAVDTNTMTLEGLDSTDWGTFTSGTLQKVESWQTVSHATGIDFGAGAADEINISVLLDAKNRTDTGLLTQPPVTVNLFTDPSLAAQAKIDEAGYTAANLAWRATRKSGKKKLWSGKPSTVGESVAINTPIAGSFTITVQSSRFVNYAS